MALKSTDLKAIHVDKLVDNRYSISEALCGKHAESNV